VFLTDHEIIFGLAVRSPRPDPGRTFERLPVGSQKTTAAAVHMRLKGANFSSTAAVGLDPLPGVSHYLHGNDPSKWVRNVPHYRAVRYPGIHPGVDLALHGSEHQMEYDLVVAKGEDASVIEPAFSAADNVSVASDGDLIFQTAVGEIRQHKPLVYQDG